MALARHVSAPLLHNVLVPSNSLTEATQVNPDEIISRLHCASLSEQDGDDDPRSQAAVNHLTPYTSRYSSQVSLPKFKIPKHGAESDTVYAMIRDELDLDGRPNLNLARYETGIDIHSL